MRGGTAGAVEAATDCGARSIAAASFDSIPAGRYAA
jgi:hypothetical protein